MELPFCKNGPLHVDDPILTPIYEKCEMEQIPVYLQWGGLFAPDLGLYNPVELDHVAVKYPKMTIICGHAGWPFCNRDLSDSVMSWQCLFSTGYVYDTEYAWL